MKYFLIAGEASGDLHASAVIAAIKQRDKDAQFQFLGGDMMAQAAGVDPVVHYREMAFMGIVSVLRHLPQINRNFKMARRAIKEFMPDRVVLIDYPSFNLKMAKFAKKLGIKVVYYISPKVWAWKEWRVKTIKRVVDDMLCIFPFEVPFYAKHGMEAKYVGNPSVEEIERLLQHTIDRQALLELAGIPDKPIIALLPGSRISEISSNLPTMTAAMKQFPQYRAVVAGAPGVDRDLYAKYTHLPVVFDRTFDLLAHARAALVVSGTATLEAALARVPQVAMYRDNGTKLYRKGKDYILSVKYITLPNLIVDRELIPELIYDLCTADAVAAALGKILPNGAKRQAMLDGYAEMRAALGDENAPQMAAEIIS